MELKPAKGIVYFGLDSNRDGKIKNRVTNLDGNCSTLNIRDYKYTCRNIKMKTKTMQISSLCNSRIYNKDLDKCMMSFENNCYRRLLHKHPTWK